MKNLLLLLPLLFLALAGRAQTFQGGRDYVIARSGLNLRATPGAAGQRLATVPYLARVELLADRSFGADTIGSIPSQTPRQAMVNGYEYPAIPVVGHWVKARYGGHTGYLFDPYLASQYTLEHEHRATDHFLVSPGENCGDLFQDTKAFYEYAIYGYEDSLRILPVRGSYVMLELEIGGHAPHYYLPVMQDVRYVIGSRKPLDPGAMDFHLLPYAFEPDTAAYRESMRRVGLFVGDTVLHDNTYDHQLETFELRRGPLTQRGRTNWTYGVHLLGHGDLDGDGLPDYLIDVSADMSTERRLYLSSEARPGEVARHVATEEFGPCC